MGACLGAWWQLERLLGGGATGLPAAQVAAMLREDPGPLVEVEVPKSSDDDEGGAEGAEAEGGEDAGSARGGRRGAAGGRQGAMPGSAAGGTAGGTG